MNEARKYIERLCSENNNGRDGGDQQRFNSQAHGGSDRGRDGGHSNPSSDSRTIEIDHSNVGLIIGRSGAKIRELEEKFKVVLRIGKLMKFCMRIFGRIIVIDDIADKNSNENGRATVCIRGDARDIEQVTSEINELTKERQGSGGFERQREAPKQMDTAPSDFVIIDWQAAAKESVSRYLSESGSFN